MKKQVVLIAALMSVLTAAFVPATHAANPPAASKGMIAQVKNGKESMTIEVQLDKLEKKRTTVSLQDMVGKSWFSEQVWKKEMYNKRFNLSGMPEGDYILWVNGPAGEHQQMLAVQDGAVVIYQTTSGNDPEKGYVLLTAGKKEGKTIARITPEGAQSVGVQLANLKGLPTEVTLYSVGAGPVLVQNIKDKQAFAKRFNMQGMSYGSYFLTVRTKDATACQFFTLSKNGLTFGPLQFRPAKGAAMN